MNLNSKKMQPSQAGELEQDFSEVLTDEKWQAIQDNDSSYDHVFYYAVKSTKIFCRPSCPSRLPKKENIAVYLKADQPLEAGYRPCKRCRPLGQPVSKEEWIKEIDTVLLGNYQQRLRLEDLAYMVRGSESYLRHVYKELTGKTPQERLTEIRLEKAEEALRTSSLAVKKIAADVGMDNPAYFVKCFKQAYGLTPLQYRKQCKKMDKK